MKMIRIDKTVKFITFIFGMMLTSFSYGVEVNDLYQAEILVADQSLKERNAALKKALKAVFLKVGGQNSVLDNETIKKSFNRYNNYLTQYHYDRKLNTSSVESSTDLYLVATFNEDKVNQLFEQANLSIWGRLRPQVLVWIIEEDGLERNVISDSSLSVMPSQVEVFSKNRGLPLTLPLMDLDDALMVNISDLWGRFLEPVKQISARYASDTILVVRVSNSSLLSLDIDEEQACDLVVCHEKEEYILDWSLITQQQSFSQSYQGENKQELLGQVLNDVSERIYQRYALNSELSNDYVIDVANISDLPTLVSLMKFLEDLSSVDSATLMMVQGENRRIKLNLRGSKQALLASLKLNKQLEQFIDPLAPPAVDDIPVFFWGQK